MSESAPASDASLTTAATPDDDRPEVDVHETSADSFVFTENGNDDGWIATDLTVELRR